jgi:SAM-dependent methyltransferase
MKVDDMVEKYTPGHSTNATAFMAARSFATHGGFIADYIKPGMKVLDCGCGPGGLSVGLAAAVGTKGEIIGVDFAESQIAAAKIYSKSNLSFQVGSLYELPYPDSSFDLAFSHAVFEHLAEPIRAMREIHRVLRPAGVAGICSPDWDGFILSPVIDRVEAAIAQYRTLQEQNGGDTRAGRKLPSWLEQGGLSPKEVRARYECYPDSRQIAEYLAIQLERAGHANAGVALRDWASLPWTLFAQTWVSAVAIK